MADASALAGLLDRASKVFGLASSLGWELQKEFHNRPALNLILEAEETPLQTHRELINDLIAAVFDLSDVITNPPDGFISVADQLRKAGRIAQSIQKSHAGDAYAGDILELFPDLNQVGENGRQAVKDLNKLAKLDDPWAFLDEPKVADAPNNVDASDVVPTYNDIRTKIRSTREQLRHPIASHSPNYTATDAHNNFATIVAMLSKLGVQTPPLPDYRLHPLQTINFVLAALDDIELTLSRNESSVEGNNLERVQEFSGDLQAASTPQQTPAKKPSREIETVSPIGFLGSAELADALGIHVTRREAFFRQLERRRMSLGDDCWHEVRERRPNSPQFIYRADSPKLRDLAEPYKRPRPA